MRFWPATGQVYPALLRAGGSLLERKGAGSLTLREVARRAGVSHNAPYRHFPDRAALRAFILGAEETAAAYARNYGGTVKEIRKARRVSTAFQQVLDHPQALEALQHHPCRLRK